MIEVKKEKRGRGHRRRPLTSLRRGASVSRSVNQQSQSESRVCASLLQVSLQRGAERRVIGCGEGGERLREGRHNCPSSDQGEGNVREDVARRPGGKDGGKEGKRPRTLAAHVFLLPRLLQH